MGSSTRLAIAFAVLAVAAGAALGSRLLSSSPRPRLESTSFSVTGPQLIDRGSRRLTVWVEAGTCDPSRAQHPAERFDHAQVRIQRDAFVITIWMRAEQIDGDVCFGVGLPPYSKQITLPRRLGRRGVVSDSGPHHWQEIVIAPTGTRAIKALVPPFIYTDWACDAVASAFKHRSRDEWCY